MDGDVLGVVAAARRHAAQAARLEERHHLVGDAHGDRAAASSTISLGLEARLLDELAARRRREALGLAGRATSPTRPAGSSITRWSTGRRYCSTSTISRSGVTATRTTMPVTPCRVTYSQPGASTKRR